MGTLKPNIELRITNYAVTATELTINYSAASLSTAPVYLVSHQRLPFVRLSPDRTTIEIWQGIPPRNQAELTRAINLLQLPGTQELAPSAVVNKTAVVPVPMRESGYWLAESEYTPLPLGNRTQFQVVSISGIRPDPRSTTVRSINELYAWQLTERSPPFNLTRVVR